MATEIRLYKNDSVRIKINMGQLIKITIHITLSSENIDVANLSPTQQ